MVALLGPNGSGKSTLFKLVAGALKPAGGSVRLGATLIRALSRRELARRLAVVAQDITVPFNFTVAEVVSFGRTAYAPLLSGLTSIDRLAIERALALTDTTRFADRHFGTLSGGERQRALLAMALAQEPEVLLLDEPTAHLDIHYQVEMLDLLQQLHAGGKLTVCVTLHDLNLASLYFPRLILMAAGQVVADGAADDVLRPEVLGPVFHRRLTLLRHPTRGVPLVAPEPGNRGDGQV